MTPTKTRLNGVAQHYPVHFKAQTSSPKFHESILACLVGLDRHTRMSISSNIHPQRLTRTRSFLVYMNLRHIPPMHQTLFP